MHIPFTSKEGIELFHSIPKNDISVDLLSSFTHQQHPSLCSLACIVSLVKACPQSFKFSAKENVIINHERLFDHGEIEEIRSLGRITGEIPSERQGLSMDEVKQIILTAFFDMTVEIYRGREFGLNEFSDFLRERFNHQSYLIACYYGQTLGLDLNGHYATIGAIHFSQKKILLLDPASHKTTWYWVSFNDLLVSMQKFIIPEQKICRGLFTVNQKEAT